MKIKFLKDFDDIQHKKDETSTLNEMDKINNNQVTLCIGHGSYINLTIGEDVELIPDKQTMEEFLHKLYVSLKKSQKRWCAEVVDDVEEMWTEYSELINELVPAIEELLDIPPTDLIIKSAFYGSGEEFNDVKKQIEENIDFNRCSMQINNITMQGDPAYGKFKVLKVIYSYEGQEKRIIIPEGDTLKLP